MTNYYKILDGASALQPQCKGLNKYRHFFLYAKGFYKQTTLIDDLKILVSNFYNNNSIDYEFVDIGDIYKILSKCIKNYVNSSDKFLRFTEYLFSVGNLGKLGYSSALF